MLYLFLIALLGAGYWHGSRGEYSGSQRRYELMLVYLLAGYCGITMVGVSLWGLVDPSVLQGMVRAEPGSPFQGFFVVTYLGMSVMATLSIWIRGTYLIANVISWSIYWFGATILHLMDYQAAGDLSPVMAVRIVGAHALVPVVLIALLALSLRAAPKGGE